LVRYVILKEDNMRKPFAAIYIWLMAGIVALVFILTGILVGSLWLLKKFIEVL